MCREADLFSLPGKNFILEWDVAYLFGLLGDSFVDPHFIDDVIHFFSAQTVITVYVLAFKQGISRPFKVRFISSICRGSKRQNQESDSTGTGSRHIHPVLWRRLTALCSVVCISLNKLLTPVNPTCVLTC